MQSVGVRDIRKEGHRRDEEVTDTWYITPPPGKFKDRASTPGYGQHGGAGCSVGYGHIVSWEGSHAFQGNVFTGVEIFL